MNVVEDFASLAETAGFVNVQRYVLQDAPDAAIAFRGPYGGRSPETEFGSEALSAAWPRVQVLIRGPQDDAVEPAARAQALAAALSKEGVTVNGTLYLLIRPLQFPPFWLEQDRNRRHVYAFNVEGYAEV